LPTVKSIVPDDQFDIQSESFEKHQKSASGNGRIASMFNTYFRLPKTFPEQLYLSQVLQAFAIRMGCEFWRTRKPVTRGILDCWPASSWSSSSPEAAVLSCKALLRANSRNFSRRSRNSRFATLDRE
jgi:beta-mannosidase